MSQNNDLISRAAAIKAVTGWDSEPTDEELERVLNKLPAVDAEVVRHGVWLTDLYNMKTYETYTVPFESWKHSDAYCSVCKQSALCNGHEEDVDSRYCPNCGARMDGEVIP